MADFVMVPVESLKPGDVVAMDGTPTHLATPVAEVNRRADGVELVFIEKSVVADHGVRIAAVYRYQHPAALLKQSTMESRVGEEVERWLGSVTASD